MAIGSHHSANSLTNTWLTPPHIIDALGGWESFDIDPATPPEMPFRTAIHMVSEAEDGLKTAWRGRAWLNPPYSRLLIEQFMARMADHGHGTALVFARTETEWARKSVWGAASGVMFLHGRLHFHRIDGSRAENNAGAPSMLVAYGVDDLDRLRGSGLDGALVPITPIAGIYLLQRSVSVDRSWRTLIRDAIRSLGGRADLRDIYAHLEGHPKCLANRNWKPKVRQVCGVVANRVDEATYALAAA